MQSMKLFVSLIQAVHRSGVNHHASSMQAVCCWLPTVGEILMPSPVGGEAASMPRMRHGWRPTLRSLTIKSTHLLPLKSSHTSTPSCRQYPWISPISTSVQTTTCSLVGMSRSFCCHNVILPSATSRLPAICPLGLFPRELCAHSDNLTRQYCDTSETTRSLWVRCGRNFGLD